VIVYPIVHLMWSPIPVLTVLNIA